MEKNCDWNGCRHYYKLDERFAKIYKMKTNQLKSLLEEFNANVKFEYDLKKKIGLILEERLKFIIKQTI